MIARRLLIAGGGSGGFTSPHQVLSLTSVSEGGWTQKPRSKAVYHAGYTYIGYVTGDDGDLKVAVVPDATRVAGTPITLHATFEVDSHAAPALIIRDSDHKLIVMYCTHTGANMYKRISTNSLDSDPTLSGGFAAEVTAFSGTEVTYPMLIQRLAETNTPIYCFYRERGTGTSVLSYRKSSDDGVTWSSAQGIYASTGNSTYWDIFSDGQWRIDFVVTDCVTTDQLGDIYHFYADDTDYHKSDGTAIGSFGPVFDTTHLTKVYDHTTSGRAWSHDGYLDSDGHPRFIFGIAPDWSPPGGTDTQYEYARWSGSAWVLTTILASGGAGQFDPMLSCLDAVDETRAYLSRYISSHFEMWQYTTADDGATWTGAALTSGSSADNIYPVSVKDHPSPGISLLWLTGTYTSATSNSLGISGYR